MATPDHAQIGDFSDRELLAVMVDLGDNIFARDLALRIFGIRDREENEDAIRHLARCVTQRLVWMKRYGLVDRDAETKEWSLSDTGVALRKGGLGKAVSEKIETAGENSLLELGNVVGQRLLKAGTIEGRALQRELTFQITRRKGMYR